MTTKIRLNALSKTLIIAEIGSNYRISDKPAMNFRHAIRLIDSAKKHGADAVKFQLFRARKLYVPQAGYADYLGKKQSIYGIIRQNELPYEWLAGLKRYCDRKNILFLCTPFDEESVGQLERINVPVYKIASYTINHLELIRCIAKTKKPVIMSTGASRPEDIRRAVRVIRKAGNHNYALMQCTAKYPAPLDTMMLRSIPFMQKFFRCPVGLSDHSRDPLIAPLGAVALGAKIIEKHFTTDNCLPGPDHRFAVTPKELGTMVKGIRGLELALGCEGKRILPDEEELYRFCRRKIFSIRPVSKGEKLSRDNIAALRPGKVTGGLDAAYLAGLYGRKLKRPVRAYRPITESLLQ